MRQVPPKANKGRNILLCITGSIAAYKSAELARLLVKQGCFVKTVMTQASQQFIGKATFGAITHQLVYDNLFSNPMAHVDLARWADFILIAPCSANTMAKLTHGACDDLLTSICLATQSPVYIAPAMNQQMWAHQATQNNAAILSARGVYILGPDSGEQACGETGPGRMLEPAIIMRLIAKNLSDKPQDDTLEEGKSYADDSLPGLSGFRRGGPLSPPVFSHENPSYATKDCLSGKTVLITAGPTYEPIDPVRFIGNYSSGKMGYALAQAAHDAGAEVMLISGPVSLTVPEGVACIAVQTAAEMYQAVMAKVAQVDILISAAAVADYRPKCVLSSKFKKQSDVDSIQLDLMRTKDILHSVAQLPCKPFLVGFAAETHDVLSYAEQKCKAKQLDMIVANQVLDGKPFGHDENEVWILQSDQDKAPIHIGPASKIKIAAKVIDDIAQSLDNRT